MSNWKNGNVNISDKLVVRPGYTFDEFKNTEFYTDQDGIRIITLDGAQVIDGRQYLVDLFFSEGRIYCLSLMNCEKEFTWETEKERKTLHDAILAEYEIGEKEEFDWGKIVSNFDSRSTVSEIKFFYN